MSDWEARELENTPAGKIINYGQLHTDWITFFSTFVLSNHEKYTGQTLRGTAETLGADVGLNDSEIQNITGHRSASFLKV